MEAHCIHFELRGPFRVSAPDGSDRTPRGRKSVGLLAMLAEPAHKSRNRRWLEDKLWSDRGPEQAQGSLRTALSEIRRAFGEYDALKTDRNSVWLDAAMVTTDLGEGASHREFLEGIDIADPEFNHWLTEMRLKHEDLKVPDTQPRPSGRTISVHCAAPAIRHTRFDPHATIVGDQIGGMITGFIARSSRSASGAGADLVVETALDETEDGALVSVRVIDTKTDQILQSSYTTCESLVGWLGDPAGMSRFCFGVADATLERLSQTRREDNPAAQRASFAQEALSLTLSFDSNRMLRGIAVLDDAAEQIEAGLFLSLKAWSLTSAIVEDILPEDAAAREQVADLLRRAHALSPGDPMVMALSASARVTLLADYGTAYDLAAKALRYNPANPIALQALSAAQAVSQHYRDAYAHSARALEISALSKFEARTYLHHALLCMNMGKTGEAIERLTTACMSSPSYRAPRRQLLALTALSGDETTCRKVLGELRVLEPDFSLDRFMHDDDYHTHTLRRTGMMSRVRKRLAGMGLRDKV